MTVYAAMLRGVNVGGKQSLPSKRLEEACRSAEFSDVRVYLQSGNVVFSTPVRSKRAAVSALREAVRATAGPDVAVLLRTRRELDAVVAGNPFADEARESPGRLLVLFLDEPPSASACAALEALRSPSEKLLFSGREAYAFFGDGAGRSKLADAFTPKKLGVDCTARNWNTVNALARLTAELESERRR